MLSNRYESTEVDRRTWLHVPSGTHWSTSSDTQEVVEIQIETSTKMCTPFFFYIIVCRLGVFVIRLRQTSSLFSISKGPMNVSPKWITFQNKVQQFHKSIP